MDMNSKTYIVMGEARESDSEEEIDSSTVKSEQTGPCSGKIVYGEAPESDEECCVTPGSVDSVSSAVSALSVPTVNKTEKSHKKHQSILVKKLYERNSALHKHITEFVQQTATNAGAELNTVNKRLLKCQMQIQEGSDYLKIINSSLTALDSHLQMLLSTQYLPVIKVDENVEQEVKKKPP